MTTSTKNPTETGVSGGRSSVRLVLVGVPASPGFAMGRAFQVISRELTVVEETISESRVQTEEQVFLKAVERTSKEINQIKEISETRSTTASSLRLT